MSACAAITRRHLLDFIHVRRSEWNFLYIRIFGNKKTYNVIVWIYLKIKVTIYLLIQLKKSDYSCIIQNVQDEKKSFWANKQTATQCINKK